MANESESTVHTNQMKNNPPHPGTLNPLPFIKSSSNRDRQIVLRYSHDLDVNKPLRIRPVCINEPNVTSRNRARCIREKVLIQLGLMLLASLHVPLELSTFQYNMHLFFPPLLERQKPFLLFLWPCSSYKNQCHASLRAGNLHYKLKAASFSEQKSQKKARIRRRLITYRY